MSDINVYFVINICLRVSIRVHSFHCYLITQYHIDMLNDSAIYMYVHVHVVYITNFRMLNFMMIQPTVRERWCLIWLHKPQQSKE